MKEIEKVTLDGVTYKVEDLTVKVKEFDLNTNYLVLQFFF